MRKVINKMVTEEDLIRTVSACVPCRWWQIKLYFMLVRSAHQQRRGCPADRRAGQAGHRDGGKFGGMCTVSIGI